MTAATRREMLRDVDREIRDAALVACGLKGDRQLITDLIGIDDPFTIEMSVL